MLSAAEPKHKGFNSFFHLSDQKRTMAVRSTQNTELCFQDYMYIVQLCKSNLNLNKKQTAISSVMFQLKIQAYLLKQSLEVYI